MSNHKPELLAFLTDNIVDVLLVTETHFTNKSFFSIPNYKLYHTTHPDNKAHGGSAVLIKNNVKHYQEISFQNEQFQATNVIVEDWIGKLLISSVYSPPKHQIKHDDYIKLFKSFGNRFIAGGDYNAKHIRWGSRLTTPKGRQLISALTTLNLKFASTGEPTYWPTDTKKVPDLIDFFVTKGIASQEIMCKSSFDLSSDHSPVFATIKKDLINNGQECHLSSKKTDWLEYRRILQESLNLQIPLKCEVDLAEAVEHFNSCVQQAAWSSTPISTNSLLKSNTPSIREKLIEKRRCRKMWQQTRHPSDKATLNKLSKELTKMVQVQQNLTFETQLKELDSTKSTDYSLWKASKALKQTITGQPPIIKADKTYAKSYTEKANTFADHLENVFQPNPVDNSVEQLVTSRLDEIHQLELPIKKFSISEVIAALKNLKIKKAPGYDLISPILLKELPFEGIKLLTFVFNAILRTGIIPPQWKVAQISMFLKPGKIPTDVKSYRPISLLPVASKVMETLFLSRLMPIVNSKCLIPKHQFGFRKEHSTIEQVHRLVEKILVSFDKKEYCTAAFLDISQAFDRVWHNGLLYKIKTTIPINYYVLIESYLNSRCFLVKSGTEYSSIRPIKAGVPQGSVMGPLLYLLYTADLPLTNDALIGTFADDTAILSTDPNPASASEKLQKSLDKIIAWTKKWGIKTNETKSVQVTFTLRTASCPPVKINNIEIPQSTEAKYLGLHLDRKLNWKKHIFTKRKALGLQQRKMFPLLERKSKLSIENKLLLYKCVLKPIWVYGIQLWGTASNSNIEILQRFQSNVLRNIVNAPKYISNVQLHKELNVTTVKEEISLKAQQYKSRISQHPNDLVSQLMLSPTLFKRLKRTAPQNL